MTDTVFTDGQTNVVSAWLNDVNTGIYRGNASIWCGTAGGTANAITVTPNITIPSYAKGMRIIFVTASANTGATTIKVGSLGVISIVKNAAAVLVANDLPSGALIEVIYDGTNFNLIGATNLTQTANTFSALNNFTGGLQKAGNSVVGATDAAGGSLTGTYPNPTITTLAVTAAMIANSTITNTQIAQTNSILPAALALTNRSQFFTGSGTFTAGPAGNYVVIAQGNGSGGGSGSGVAAANTETGQGGEGGLPGLLKIAVVTLTAGQAVTVTIPAQSAGGAAPNAGGNDGNPGTVGGNVTFGSLVTATGGAATRGGRYIALLTLKSSSANGGNGIGNGGGLGATSGSGTGAAGSDATASSGAGGGGGAGATNNATTDRAGGPGGKGATGWVLVLW